MSIEMLQIVMSHVALLVQRIKNKGAVLSQTINEYKDSFVKSIKADGLKVLPIVSFVIPIFLLYFIYPNTYEPVWTGTWKNRMYYLFFIWILVLETVLSWNELKTKKLDPRSAKFILVVVTLLLPTIYVILANYFGLNATIVTLSKDYNVREGWAELMPLSIEYLVFAALLALIITSASSLHGLKNYLISTFLLALVGAIYMVDNIYPFGAFTPFQILVVPTATCASTFLRMMGYTTSLSTQGGMPVLVASSLNGANFGAQIAWPCSGVESLLIYTLVILLFLGKSAIPLAHKIVYFVVGAIVTYLINILRITTLFVIAINGGDWGLFHDYYGSLYSISWIICYPLIIIGSQVLSERIRNWKADMASVNRHLSTPAKF
jgi:thaumarchaeosortase